MSDLIPDLHRGQVDRNSLRQVLLIAAGVATIVRSRKFRGLVMTIDKHNLATVEKMWRREVAAATYRHLANREPDPSARTS
jgi:hypothetical protein